mgnify:FL=1
MATWYCNDTKLPYQLDWKDIEFTEPYPITMWRCDDTKLPYKVSWKDIKAQAPYPATVWLCDDTRLPYKQLWKDIEAYTTLKLPQVNYEAQLITEVNYIVKTPAKIYNLTTRVFEDRNKVYAYKGLNKQLTIISTENTTTVWFDNMLAFNNSTVTIKLGQFTYNIQDKIQLFLSESIPTEWDLGDFYSQTLGIANTEISFNVAENVMKYMGIGFANATVGIVSIYVDNVKVV